MDSRFSDYVDAMCRVDFASFYGRVMATLEPGNPYEENWHVHAIAQRLEQVRHGTIKRLMINVPPRSMKTMLTSVAYAAWRLGHDPGCRIICVTYSREIAKEHAALFCRLVAEPWFRRVFHNCHPVTPNRDMDWHTEVGGYRLATSIGGSVLSRGADLIIIDDPNKGQEIYSRVYREKVKNAYDHTISTRLVHPKESAIVCVMQRLHDDDLAGHMMKQEKWHELVIPAIATRNERWDLGDGNTYLRKKNELLQPSRMGAEEIENRKRVSGLTAFNAQYQQQPIPDDGIVIRKTWLRYYDEAPDRFEVKIASWDTASTLKDDADWSVGTIWGLYEHELYLLHVERARLEAPDLRHCIERLHRQHGLDATLIEDADLGRGIAQDLRRSSGYCRPRLVRPTIDKLARMQARSVMFETGKVLFPREAPWLAVYLDELLGFPNRRHDDQVDSTSQALDWFQQKFSGDISPRIRKRPEGKRRPTGTPRRI